MPLYVAHKCRGASQVALVVKNLPASAGDTRDAVQSLGQEDPLRWEMANHYSILAWRIPWTEKSCGLQSIGSQTVGQTRLNQLSTHKGRVRKKKKVHGSQRESHKNLRHQLLQYPRLDQLLRLAANLVDILYRHG